MGIRTNTLMTVILTAVLLTGCMQQQPQGNQTVTPTNPNQAAEAACIQSGGEVTTRPCCGSVGDFPNTCLIGACGCSPSNSHEVEVCSCGDGKCWNASENKCVNFSQTVTPPVNGTPSKNITVSIFQIYNYSSLHSYDYKLSLNTSVQTALPDMKSTVTSDSVNGTAVWMEQTDLIVQGNTMTKKSWFSKDSHNCIKATTSISFGGNVTEVQSQCPNWAVGPGYNLTYMGQESVTVPLGTYKANKYYSYGDGVTYWSVSSVPVPLKIVYPGTVATIEELVSYT